MKDHLTRVFIVFGCVLLTTDLVAQIIGTSFREAIETRKANLVYVYNDVQDFARKNDNGDVEGILVDLMMEFQSFVQRKYQIDITSSYQQIEELDFKKFLNAVETSNYGVFGLSNTSITEQRKSIYSFSYPYIDNISVLITAESIETLGTLEDMGEKFEGMKAISVPSSTYLERLQRIKSSHHPDMKIELVNSGREVIERVQQDKSYFAVVDLLYYLEFFKNGASIKRHKVGDEVGDRFGVLMPKSNDWKPILDEFFLSGFMQSSKYRVIISNHLGASATRLISPVSSYSLKD